MRGRESFSSRRTASPNLAWRQPAARKGVPTLPANDIKMHYDTFVMTRLSRLRTSSIAVVSTLVACCSACDRGNAPQTAGATSTSSQSPAAAATQSATDPAAKSAVLAPASKDVTYSAAELTKVMDFATLPRMPGTKVGTAGAAHFSAKVPAKVPEVAAFYFDVFAKLGWTSANPNDQSPSADNASAILAKDGYSVSLTIYKAGEPDTSSIDFVALGNFDTRKLPRLKGAEKPYESPISTIYFASTKVPAAADELLMLLSADGWQVYDRVEGGTAAANDEMRIFKLRKRGYSLDVDVSVAPAENNQTSVEYAVRALTHELPTPPHATNVQFDDDRGELKCIAPGDFKSAIEFYRREMSELGYKPLPGEKPGENDGNLRFAGPRGDEIVVQVEKSSERTVKVLIDPAVAEKQ